MAKQKITFKASENFTLDELIHSTTANKYRIGNEPNDEQIRNLQYGVDMVLQPLRNIYGKPVVITSGYRSRALNKLVGGVANSYHLQGNAADIRIHSQVEAKEIFDIKNIIPFHNNAFTLFLMQNKKDPARILFANRFCKNREQH